MKRLFLTALLLLTLISCTTFDKDLMENEVLRSSFVEEIPTVIARIDPYLLRPSLFNRYPTNQLYNTSVRYLVPFMQDNPMLLPARHEGFDLGYGLFLDVKGNITLDITHFLENSNADFTIDMKYDNIIMAYASSIYTKTNNQFTKGEELLFIEHNDTRLYNYSFDGVLIAEKIGQEPVLKQDDDEYIAEIHTSDPDDFRYIRAEVSNQKDMNSIHFAHNAVQDIWYSTGFPTLTGQWVNAFTYEITDYMRIEYFPDKIQFTALERYYEGYEMNSWLNSKTFTLIKIDNTYYFYDEFYNGNQFTIEDNTITVSGLQQGDKAYTFTLIQ